MHVQQNEIILQNFVYVYESKANCLENNAEIFNVTNNNSTFVILKSDWTGKDGKC